MSLSACAANQSVLHPASLDAGDVTMLFWFMATAGALIMVGG